MAGILDGSAARRGLSSVCVPAIKERSIFGAACWVTLLRQWMTMEGQLAVRREEAGEEEGEAVLRGHWACVAESLA